MAKYELECACGECFTIDNPGTKEPIRCPVCGSREFIQIYGGLRVNCKGTVVPAGENPCCGCCCGK
ncbi:MAG: hypothetical protein ACOYD6_07820 [Limnochordia bacterium]